MLCRIESVSDDKMASCPKSTITLRDFARTNMVAGKFEHHNRALKRIILQVIRRFRADAVIYRNVKEFFRVTLRVESRRLRVEYNAFSADRSEKAVELGLVLAELFAVDRYQE